MTKVVGVGGFGVVYRAMWKSRRMIVAVKRIQHFETESQELGEEVGKQDLCLVCLLQFCHFVYSTFLHLIAVVSHTV